VDIAQVNDVEFVVPYMSVYPWTECGTFDSANRPHIAAVHVVVLNELRRPNTIVSDVIDVIIEKSGGDDLQFAEPRSVDYYTLFDVGTPPPIQAMAQSVWTMEDYQLQRDDTEPLFKSNSREIDLIKEETIGESIVSVKQLLNRNVLYYKGPLRPSFICLDSGVVATSLYDTRLTANSGTDGTVMRPWDWFGSLYAFWRGGRRLKIFPDNNIDGANAGGLVASLAYGNEVNYAATPASNHQLANTAFNDTNTRVRGSLTKEGVFEVEAPYYGDRVMKLSPFTSISEFTLIPRVTLVQFAGASTTPVEIYSSCADDFSMGFMIGAPLVRRFITA